jgi:O-antigen/teichoic acid export membrane protein
LATPELAVRSRRLAAKHPLSVTVNALAVMAGKTLTMGLGFVFWLVAAHEFARSEVGIAAAVVSAMMLCTQFAIGGVGSAVITCYADFHRRPARLLDTSVTVVVISALCAAAAFLLVAGLGLRHLGVVAGNPLYALGFVAMTVFGTVAILLDQLSIALGRGDQVLVRGLAFGGVTVAGIGLLPLVAHRADSAVIFAPWVIAGAVNVGLGVLQLRRTLPSYRFRARADRRMTRVLLRHGLPNYGLTLAERAPGLILPIVVTEVLTPADNSTWYAVWMMAWVVYTMPISAGLTLFAEASNRPTQLAQATRAALRVALLVGLAASLFLGALAHPVLSLLGSQYGATGASPLRILLIAFVPLTFVQVYFASSRARRRLGEALATGWISAAVSVAAATGGALLGGLEGMAIAWLGVQLVTGMWATFRTALLRGRPRAYLHRVWVPTISAASRVTRDVVAFGSAVDQIGIATLATIASAAVAVVIWALSLQHVVLENMNGLGLVSVLHPGFYAALALLTVAFVATLARERAPEQLFFALVVGLVVVLFGLTPILEAVPRFAVTWRHVGIAQSILDTGRIDPRIDAYFNWPGFFALAGAVARAAGFRSALPLAAWSPLYLNLAYMLPLLAIARSLTVSRRLVWLSVWLFYLGNWIGQDYFSPQGFSFFFYLLILAVLMRWFVERPGRPRPSSLRLVDLSPRFVAVEPVEPVPALANTGRRYLLACIILLFVASVPMHQLTPVAVLFSTAAIVLLAARPLAWLPALMVVLLVGWWTTGARTFFNGHLSGMLGQAGQLGAVFTANVANRVGGDFDHRIVADLTLLAGATLWALACLGAWRLLQGDWRYRVVVGLAVAPLPLLPLQTYGGEMLLRVELFALPFTAFLAAAALVGRDDREGEQDAPRFGTRRVVVVAAVLLSFAALFLIARYGNEKINYFTRDEVTAVEHLYALAEPGSTLVAGTGNLPWKYTEYQSHRYRLVIEMPHWSARASITQNLAPLLRDVRASMSSTGPRSYLIIARSEEVEVDQLGYGRPGSLTRFADAVAHSPSFRIVYRNPAATIFALAPPDQTTTAERPAPAGAPAAVWRRHRP